MGSKRSSNTNWDDKTREALEHLIDDLKASLGPSASIAEIERALHKHAPAFLSDTFQALADDPALSPPGDKRET